VSSTTPPPILCRLFLCELNLTPFSPCQIFLPLSPHSLAPPSKLFSETTAVSSTTPPLERSLPNGKAERTLHTLNNMIRSLLFQASFPVRYWTDGLHTVMYLLNRLSNKTIRESCPYVALHGVAPSYEHLWMFSCVCYPNLSAQAPHKLPPGPPDVPSSDVLPITNAIGVSISPPITSSSQDMLFFMRQTSPSLSRLV
jgi:hypothetical protein